MPTFSEMNQLYGWWYVALVCAVLALLALMTVMICIILFTENESAIHQKTLRMIDRFTEGFAFFLKSHFLYEDEEPECPSWAEPEKWEESLMKYKIR